MFSLVLLFNFPHSRFNIFLEFICSFLSTSVRFICRLYSSWHCFFWRAKEEAEEKLQDQVEQQEEWCGVKGGRREKEKVCSAGYMWEKFTRAKRHIIWISTGWEEEGKFKRNCCSSVRQYCQSFYTLHFIFLYSAPPVRRAFCLDSSLLLFDFKLSAFFNIQTRRKNPSLKWMKFHPSLLHSQSLAAYSLLYFRHNEFFHETTAVDVTAAHTNSSYGYGIMLDRSVESFAHSICRQTFSQNQQKLPLVNFNKLNKLAYT